MHPLQTDPGKLVEANLSSRRNSIFNRQLLIAADGGDIGTIKTLIESGADVDFVDNDGNTALHYAASRDRLEVVRLLVQQMTDVNVENNCNRMPLDLARKRGDVVIVDAIEEQILKNSLAVLKERCPGRQQQSHLKPQKIHFVENTFSGKYFTKLSFKDVENILDMLYTKSETEVMFGAVKVECLSETIKESLKTNKTCVFLVELNEQHWATIVKFTNADKKSFRYICCNHKDSNHQVLLKVIKDLQIVDHEQYNFPQCNVNDSAIIATKCAEFVYHDKLYDVSKLEKINTKEERILFANLLNEKKRTEEKIQSCLQSLKQWNQTYDRSEFNFKNSNIFVLFLETFALEDTYPVFPSNGEEENKDMLKKIKKIKKEYFSHFYFKPKNHKTEGQPDLGLISDARSSILHGSRIVTSEDFSKFVGEGISVKDFFLKLEKFTNKIHNKLKGKCGLVHHTLKCNSFLAPKDSFKEQGTKEGEQEFLESFVTQLYSPEKELNYEMLEELMFNLAVNVIPLLDNKKQTFKPLSLLRNRLIHDFHKYSDNQERLRELKHLALDLKSKLYKYFYASKIHNALKSTCLHKTSEQINFELIRTLRNFEENFANKTNVVAATNANSFEFVFEQSIFSERREEIEKLVHQYCKFIIPIEHDLENKGALTGEDDDNNLINLQKRELFEEFLKIKDNYSQHCEDVRQEKLIELKNKLIILGISEHTITKIWDCYVNNDHVFEADTEREIKRIIDSIAVIKHVLVNHTVPFETVMSSYEMNDYKRMKEQVEGNHNADDIIDKFKCLPRGNCLMSIGGDEVKINVVTTIVGAMNLFYKCYNKYRIKFNNAIEAFSDEYFLSKLVEIDIKFNPETELYAFLIVKKLLHIEYTAPYIVKVLEAFPNVLIEKEDLKKLLENLCEKDCRLPYLTTLVDVRKSDSNFNIFEEILSLTFKMDSLSSKILKHVMQGADNIEGILKVASGGATLSQLRLIFLTLQGVLIELIFENKFTVAEKIVDLEIMQTLRASSVDRELTIIFNDLLLLAAKIKNFCGKDRNLPKLYQQSLDLLGSIKHPSNLQVLLSMSRRAYTNQLLNELDEAYMEYQRLYEEIIKYCLDINDLPKHDASELLEKVLKTDKYLNLMIDSDHDQKYLTLSRIKASMAFILEIQRKYKAALCIYRDIYCTLSSLGEPKINISRSLKSIARVESFIGKIYCEEKTYDSLKMASEYYMDSLISYIKLLKIYNTLYGSIHPTIQATSRLVKFNVLKPLRNVCIHLAQCRETDEATRRDIYNKTEKLKEELKLIEC
ncbi:uncharacterized protein LOC120426795 [Culex pipiens pallens]|uniref:uncharacterized protein LOC120426795 n=1 Tax=Culex pipiens pallens TaxID=42434 RepID=UPI0019533D6C|nr:uncharacterized protein LOC120426795 [Culex pipiens pallens]